MNGAVLVGCDERQKTEKFHAVYPQSGRHSDISFSEADERDVIDACVLAARAADIFGDLQPEARATFLEKIAEGILDIGDALIETAMAESGLPRARLEGERSRTINQLRLFAAEVRKGEWLDITIDPALPDRPIPRPDLRRMNVPVGPVAVFGASNFPLAFSVAGGDTASAFAAGCPVVAKGHPAHPGTGELVARAILSAAKAVGLPDGVFSYLPGKSHELGAALVADPRIQAVGFTGSRAGGLALVSIASGRKDPIPVYAEMSSINPVVLLPQALAERAPDIATAFINSLTMGAGQFCTNPGLLITLEGPHLDRFLEGVAAATAMAAPAAMLTPAIHEAYGQGVAALSAFDDVRKIAEGSSAEGPNLCVPALFETRAATFLGRPELHREIFGPCSLLVRCRTIEEMIDVIESLEGQLTATLQMGPDDLHIAVRLLPRLREKAGRVLANGWPTGVEVTHAMVHGGPYPSTSDGRTTSVGTLAIYRFLRPVCYQDLPDSLLPPALQQNNPWKLPRKIDGVRDNGPSP